MVLVMVLVVLGLVLQWQAIADTNAKQTTPRTTQTATRTTQTTTVTIRNEPGQLEMSSLYVFLYFLLWLKDLTITLAKSTYA